MVGGKYSVYIHHIYIYTRTIYTYTLSFWGQIALLSGDICGSFFGESLPCFFEKLISEGSHCLEHVLANDECWLLELAQKSTKMSDRLQPKKTGVYVFWGFSDVTFCFFAKES